MLQVTKGNADFRAATPPEMTYEQFLDWLDDETHAEWVDNKVVFISPVSSEHSRVTLFLAAILGFYIDRKKSGVLLVEPFQMKIGPDLPGRSPDLLFVATQNHARLQKVFLNGPADLVVEVISPESRKRDRGEKFYE